MQCDFKISTQGRSVVRHLRDYYDSLVFIVLHTSLMFAMFFSNFCLVFELPKNLVFLSVTAFTPPPPSPSPTSLSRSHSSLVSSSVSSLSDSSTSSSSQLLHLRPIIIHYFIRLSLIHQIVIISSDCH